jgi:shikimate 5-dehydrogenase
MRELACLRLAAAGFLAACLSLGAGGAAKALYDVEPSEIP